MVEPSADRDVTIHLRAAGVSVLVSSPAGRLPVIAHWGPDLGALDPEGLAEILRSGIPPLATNGVDTPHPLAVLPEPWTGWTGTPGLVGHRHGAAWSPRFTTNGLDLRDDGALGGRLTVSARDSAAGLGLLIELELTPSGVLRVRARVTNEVPEPYLLDALAVALPVPSDSDEILDLAGRWAGERSPQRHDFVVGTHLREGRHGRTGADAATVMAAGPRGFGFRTGEVRGVHVAWSGNHRSFAERVFTGERVLGGGELLLPGEVELAEGDCYTSPWLYGSYGEGLDGVAARFHAWVRSRPAHPSTPRPVTLNVWEAVYFDQSAERLCELVELGAKVGAERFVLDDGWFRGRRDDTAGLGDWYIDESVWPGGLRPLADQVHALGMQFGLWFEPEMINLNSDLARAHPEWILHVPGRLPVEARHQQVLDVANPAVFNHLRERIVALVRECDIDYIKWDHNRDLVDAASIRSRRASVHAQTQAVYVLMDTVHEACPGLEIESCSSGGARIDLEILEHTQRVWASDCIDPHERQQIQRWTAQLVPPELIGAHVGAERAHTTGRVHDLGFRAATALFGHLGIEWDLTAATSDELAELAAWVVFAKEMRELLHHGVTVRGDLPGDMWLHGVVSESRDEALYCVVALGRPITWPPGRMTLPGLDADRIYEVRPVGPQRASGGTRVDPGWWDAPLRLPGSVLLAAGIQVPALDPDQAALLYVREAEA